MVYGLVLGAATGSLRGVEAAAYARYYGTAHIGAVRGVATAIGLASTALGPVLLSLGHDAAGGYRLPVLVLAALPASVAVLSVLARPPRHPCAAPAQDPAGAAATSRAASPGSMAADSRRAVQEAGSPE